MTTSYEETFKSLQEYTFENAKIEEIFLFDCLKQPSVIQEKKILEKVDKVDKKCSIFIPKQQDTLFWCFYILKNGMISFETTNNKNFLLAKQMKIDLVFSIRKNKDILKIYKLDTISNLENNLANENNLNFKTFLSLCIIENINIIYIRKKTYYELLMNDSDDIYIVYEYPCENADHPQYNKSFKYGYKLATEKLLLDIKTNFYKVDSPNKPIKCITSYKVKDLYDICSKLAIEQINKITGKNKSKKDLYDEIITYF